jgi:Cu(I)/Ag(I) efflux system membrane fusion protein
MHIAQGTIDRVDRAKGSVTISHEAVESAKWPAMTMDFELADPAMASDLEQGQRVTFQFTIEQAGSAVISRIEPQG